MIKTVVSGVYSDVPLIYAITGPCGQARGREIAGPARLTPMVPGNSVCSCPPFVQGCGESVQKIGSGVGSSSLLILLVVAAVFFLWRKRSPSGDRQQERSPDILPEKNAEAAWMQYLFSTSSTLCGRTGRTPFFSGLWLRRRGESFSIFARR